MAPGEMAAEQGSGEGPGAGSGGPTAAPLPTRSGPTLGRFRPPSESDIVKYPTFAQKVGLRLLTKCLNSEGPDHQACISPSRQCRSARNVGPRLHAAQGEEARHGWPGVGE